MDIAGLLRDYQANILDLGTFARLSLRLATGDSGDQLNVLSFLSQTTLNVEQLLSEVNQLVRGKLAIASIPSFNVTWHDPSLLMDVSVDRVQQLEDQGMFQNSGHLFFLMSAENPDKTADQIGNSANLRNNYGIKDTEILQDLEKFIREDVASIYIETLSINWLTPPTRSNPVQAQIETAMLNYPSRDDLSAILEMYAPLSHLQDQGVEVHIPTAGITDNEVADEAAIAWSKISKLEANPADIGALPATDTRVINRGFHYYQANVPNNPLVGERWAELDSNGLLVDEWVWSGIRWTAPYSLTAASPQVNINTYPAASFWGYLGTKHDVLIERISLNYNQASGFSAGTTYCSAKFQLTAIQLDQTNTTIPGNYREIGIVNQASATGSTQLDVNKIFVTSPLHYAIGVTVTKVGTGTTSIFYSGFGVQYRWVRKV